MAGALLIAPLVVAAQALPANAATGKLVVITRGPGRPLGHLADHGHARVRDLQRAADVG
jgi:hypothetical protein